MNIFVTVGTQFPFNRLVRTVDEWCAHHPEARAFGQIGPADYRPRHFESAPFINAAECRRRVEESNLVIAHAGMGSIITALELSKPIIVMPRRASLGEHRNEHQLATSRRLLSQGRISVAFGESDLMEKLSRIEEFAAADGISTKASPRLLSTIQDFVAAGRYEGRSRGAIPSEDLGLDQPHRPFVSVQ